jgi:hypothetical protein
MFVNMMLFASMVSNPSVFWTQLTPYGALIAVALLWISSNHIFVPFIILSDQSGGSLTKTRLTVSYEQMPQLMWTLTVLNVDVAYIPENERHRATRLCIPFLYIIPLKGCGQ